MIINTIDDSADPEAACEAGTTFSTPNAAAAEPSGHFLAAKTVTTIPVNPARLAWGRYDHERHRDVGEGDIHASYSADTIATSGKIRKAFRWQADLMVTVGMAGCGGIEQAEAYRLVPLKVFTGTPTSYSEKTGTAEGAEAARNDPLGFYHGMIVKQGQEKFILSGPPVVFVANDSPVRPGAETQPEEPLQMNLF